MNFGRTGKSPRFRIQTAGPWCRSGVFFFGNSLAAVRWPGLFNLDDDVDTALRFVRPGQLQGWLAGFGSDSINRMIDSVLAD